MASLRQVGKNARFLALFRFNGRQYQRALKTTQRKEALSQIARIEDIITLVERGRLAIPADVDPADFIVSDGRLTKPRMTSELVRRHASLVREASGWAIYDLTRWTRDSSLRSHELLSPHYVRHLLEQSQWLSCTATLVRIERHRRWC